MIVALAGLLFFLASGLAQTWAEEAGKGPTVNFRSGRTEQRAASKPAAPAEPAAVPVSAPAPEAPAAAQPAAVPATVAAAPAPAAAPQQAPAPTPAAVPAEPPAPPPETLWLDDELPPKAKAEGAWLWDHENFSSGVRSHGHASGEGERAHGLEMEPAIVPVNGMITQQVWLDPANPPKGISLQFRLASGEWTGVYWEAEEEVFRPSEERDLWYYGSLPEFGKWARLEILAEDLGLEGESISGLRFVTFDGRALWDRTALTEAPPIEEVEAATEPASDLRPKLGGSAK